MSPPTIPEPPSRPADLIEGREGPRRRVRWPESTSPPPHRRLRERRSHQNAGWPLSTLVPILRHPQPGLWRRPSTRSLAVGKIGFLVDLKGWGVHYSPVHP